jgi:hypothetical protein
MEKYFDAFLYLANWGSRWFMLRLPEKLLGEQVTSTCCAGESFSCYQKAGNVILSFNSEDVDHEWAEGEGWLASLLPIRADLIRGDHRALYLGWLLAVQIQEIDDETPEPPVPPGLGNLNASLDRFADFLRIDRDLIAAAAECSPGEQAASLSEREIKTWISNLSSQEKDALLERLINGDNPHLAAELRHRTILENRSGEMLTKGSRRTAGEIVYRAQILADARKKKEASQRARERAKRQREHAERRKRYLESLAGRENLLWAKVDKLIATRQPKQYDKAIILLQDLLDFSDMHNVSSDFAARMDALYSKHTRKSTLVERFRKAKLIG